jgi:hypothetical protein
MKRTACIAVVGAAIIGASLPAVGASDLKQKLSEIRTKGAVLAAQIEDARLECSGEISLNELHAAVAKALKENTFDDSDAPKWRAGMAAALRQHAQYISMTKPQQAEFCANLVANGFIN